MKRLVLGLLVGLMLFAVAPAYAGDYEQAIADATAAYVKALEAAKQQATDAKDDKTVASINAKVQAVTTRPAVIGKWGWYKGISTIKADGTCHWKGPNHEEHGVWKKADGYMFNWGEHNNDWNYLSVGADGFLSGKFVKWGGELKSETKNQAK